MEHYITEIRIEKLRHLSDVAISLNPNKKQHLILTGKNGSGKTSLLLAIQKYLQSLNDSRFIELKERRIPRMKQIKELLKKGETEIERCKIGNENALTLELINEYAEGIDILFNDDRDLEILYQQGNFVTAYFPADRKTQMIRSHGVKDIKLKDYYGIKSKPGELLHKYMVHLKTQQAYARNEGDAAVAERIQKWFDRFVNALRVLLNDNEITLKYDYKEYDFKIHEPGRMPFGFDELSDGYSSVVSIVSDLILRMDKNWLLHDEISHYDIEGIVLIDEIETHLHIELQRIILPFLTEFFPGIQFIITTHSPYILNSIPNAAVYDLERCVKLDDLSLYSSDSLAEGYFNAEEYSDNLMEKLNRYRFLKEKSSLTEEERAERAQLRSILKNIPKGLSNEALDKFYELEGTYL